MDNETGAVHGAAEEAPKKASKMKQLWAKTGLDTFTLLTMLKAAIPPTIAIAIYQSTPVAHTYGTVGYLAAIASILGLCILPRAKFIQGMLMNLIALCLATAVNILAMWSGIQARKHTTPLGANPLGYNSSQSVVCALWLFFQVYIVNYFRSARPQFNLTAILYLIVTIVSMVNAPRFPTTPAALSFARSILLAFVTGFGLATGVSFLIVPVSMRTVVFKEMTGYVMAIRATLKAQTTYLISLESQDMFSGPGGHVQDCTKCKSKHKHKPNQKDSAMSPEAAGLKAAIGGLLELHGKLHADVGLAKRETAYGKLSPDDIGRLYELLRGILMPLAGLSSTMDIFKRIADDQGVKSEQSSTLSEAPENSASGKLCTNEWQEIMKILNQPIGVMTQNMDDGLQHVLLRLQLIKPPKKGRGSGIAAHPRDDVEAEGDEVRPGSDKFRDYFQTRSMEFLSSREMILREWCARHGIQLPPDSLESDFEWNWLDLEHKLNDHDQRQIFVILFLEHLLWTASQALDSLIVWSDAKVADGTMSKKRLILPGMRRLRKWLLVLYRGEDSSLEGDQLVGSMEDTPRVILGDAFGARKDPEHLPPKGLREHLGDYMRTIPRLLRDKDSAFGFRAACATMSLAILAFLENTQTFFVTQRLQWSVIMVAFSMSRTAGASSLQFFLRCVGTMIAMVASFVIWYIVDGHTAGVIVFLYVWIAAAFYVVVKFPKVLIAAVISVVTSVLVIGYELQVKKVGVAASTSSGQPYYPIYELAPYRVATVLAGILVAFVWTIFPYPVSEHSELRKEIGVALYVAANLYSVSHETVKARVRGDEVDFDAMSITSQKLQTTRAKLFSKAQLLISSMKMKSSLTRWEIHIGGRYPKQTYDEIINLLESLMRYTALIGYVATGLLAEPIDTKWLEDFQRLITSINVTSHEVTSILVLLSSSMTSGQPLPPYLRMPKPFGLDHRMRAIDSDILSIRHMNDPGYGAFAVMQVAAKCLVQDLMELTKNVKLLVGEMDFSFHVVSTSDQSSGHSEAALAPVAGEKGKEE